jgi:hypothetical protein
MHIISEENRECFIGILFEFSMAMHILFCVGLIFHYVFFFTNFFVFFLGFLSFFPFGLVCWGQTGMPSVQRSKDIRVR